MDIIEDRHKTVPHLFVHKYRYQAGTDYWWRNDCRSILDKIINSAHRIELKGESMRKINLNKLKNQ